MEQEEAQRKRKRRWDVAHHVAAAPTAPEPSTAAAAAPQPPLPPPSSVDPVEAMRQQAAAVAAKLLRGVTQEPQRPAGSRSNKDLSTEVVINDAVPVKRHYLTKKVILDAIEARWEVAITVKGKHCPPDAVPGTTDLDKPLCLHVAAAGNKEDWQQALEGAAAEIRSIIAGRQPHIKEKPLEDPWTHFPATGPNFRRLFFGCEPPAAFNAPARLMGVNNAYVEHIVNTTGAVVKVYGPPAAPLHIFVQSDVVEQLKQAEELAASLIDTIRTEYATTYAGFFPPPPGTYAPPNLPPHPAMPPRPLPPPPPAYAYHQPPRGYNAVPPPMYLAVYPQQQQRQAYSPEDAEYAIEAENTGEQLQGEEEEEYREERDGGGGVYTYVQQQQQPENKRSYGHHRPPQSFTDEPPGEPEEGEVIMPNPYAAVYGRGGGAGQGQGEKEAPWEGEGEENYHGDEKEAE